MKEFDSSLMQEGDIILSSPQSNFISWAIKKQQLRMGYAEEAARWTHCAGVINKKGRFINARFPRVSIDHIDTYIKKNVSFVVLRPKRLSQQEREDLADSWKLQANLPYDTLSLFWWLLRRWTTRNWLSRKKALICSELIANGFVEIGHYHLLDYKDPESVMPSFFYDVGKFDLVAEFNGSPQLEP